MVTVTTQPPLAKVPALMFLTTRTLAFINMSPVLILHMSWDIVDLLSHQTSLLAAAIVRTRTVTVLGDMRGGIGPASTTLL